MKKSLLNAVLAGATLLAGAGLLPSTTRLVHAQTAVAPPMPEVPGYYRTKLGAFEVTAISDGAYNFAATQLLDNIAPAELVKELTENHLPTTYPQAINAFLVKTPTKLILVDTGLGEIPASVTALQGVLGTTGYGRLVANLRAAGYAPEQVDEILITHLHVDHIGGLVHDGRAVFPKAIVRLDQHDTDFWLSDAQRKAHPDLAPLFAGAKLALAPYQASGRLKPFNGDVALEPGVRSLPTPGHTPGHTSYLFESEGHRLIVWGDILHVPALQFANPAVRIKFDVDQATAERNRVALLGRAVREDDLIAGAHLYFPGIGHVRKDGTGYAWLPAAYPGQ